MSISQFSCKGFTVVNTLPASPGLWQELSSLWFQTTFNTCISDPLHLDFIEFWELPQTGMFWSLKSCLRNLTPVAKGSISPCGKCRFPLWSGKLRSYMPQFMANRLQKQLDPMDWGEQPCLSKLRSTCNYGMWSYMNIRSSDVIT